MEQRLNFMNTIPTVTKNLLIINTLFFVASLVFPRVGIDLNDWLGLHFFQASRFNLIQLVSYMFMHGSISHLFFNMFSLYMFGRILERTWGPQRFLVFYLVTGIGAGLIQEVTWAFDLRELLFKMNTAIESGVISSTDEFTINVINYGTETATQYLNHMITIGASGSVFGILLAFGMLFPDVELMMLFIPVPIKAKYFVIFYGVVELIGGVANFSFDNVAHFAHLGGMLFGFLLIKYWKRKDQKNGRYFY